MDKEKGVCTSCKYCGTGCCLHLFNCVNGSLWTPKWYAHGLRANLSVLDDYSRVPQEIIKEIVDEVIGDAPNVVRK